MTSSWPTETLILMFCSFLLGGIVKGVIGTGLPTVALAILTATIGIREGMAIIILPSILTNLQQGLLGGQLKQVVRRSWVFLFATFLAIWPGAALLATVNVAYLSGLLGLILLVYSAFGLGIRNLPHPGRAEKWFNPLLGGINGLLTGMTGSSIVPGVLYLQSLNMDRNRLVQTMGLLFLTSTTTLAFALQKNRLLTPELIQLSAAAFVPSYIGMLAGVRIRNKISDELFKRLFFVFMLLLAISIVIRSTVL